MQRKQAEIAQQVAEITCSPFNSIRRRMVANFAVGRGQIVIRDRRPQMMGGVIVHVERGDENLLDRVADERDQTMLVGPSIGTWVRVLSESPKIIGHEREV